LLFLLGNANNDDDNDNDTNTSVWLSDSTLADVETSSGVETATSSPPEAVPDEVVEAQQVRDSSKSAVALCDVSRISIVSTSSVPREQLSSLGGPGGPSSAAFHSTFNYPLHSTLRAAAAAASVRCPSPLPAESPVRPGSRDSQDGGGRRPRPARQRDLPPAASTGCRRCRETTPLRRQHARARLERQAPLVPRRRPDVDHHDDVGSISVSLHATRGSLPDLEDLSTDSEEYCAPIERRRYRRRRRARCDRDQAGVVDAEDRARRRHRCAHCRCPPPSTGPFVRRSADPAIFDDRREDRVLGVDAAWPPRTPSSVGRPPCRRYAPSASAARPTGCLPSIRSHGNDAVVVMETRRRACRRGVEVGCGHKRLLSRKLKLINNILCSARSADVTQLTTLGHV